MTFSEQILESISNMNGFDMWECGQFSPHIPLDRKMSMSVKLERNLDHDFISHLVDMIKAEFNNQFSNVIQEQFKTIKPIFIDQRLSKMDTFETNRLLLNELVYNLSEKSKILISGKVLLDVIESTSNFELYKNPSMSSYIRRMGNLYGRDVFVDSYMRYDENYVMNFTSINYNYQISSVVDLNGVLNIEIAFSYQINDPKMIYLFSDEMNKNYDVMMRELRNQKIKDILS